MKLKLINRAFIGIAKTDQVVQRGEVFEVDDALGKSLLVQGIFEEVKEAKNGSSTAKQSN